MGRYAVTLTKEQEKALLSDMISIQQWIDNAVYNKVRQVTDEIIEKYTKGELELETQFTQVEKVRIEKAREGNLFVDPRSLQREIKELIVKRVKIETGEERNERSG